MTLLAIARCSFMHWLWTRLQITIKLKYRLRWPNPNWFKFPFNNWLSQSAEMVTNGYVRRMRQRQQQRKQKTSNLNRLQININGHCVVFWVAARSLLRLNLFTTQFNDLNAWKMTYQLSKIGQQSISIVYPFRHSTVNPMDVSFNFARSSCKIFI